MVVSDMTSSNGGAATTKTETSSATATTTLANHTGNISDDDDDMGDIPSSNESDSGGYDDDGSNLMSPTSDDVRAQLAAAGPVGMAAAAAIASAKKRKRPHSFETNPSIRRRQQTRLLRKLRQTIDEYATRVGQQAIVLVASPGKPQNNFRVFGAKPLEDVVKSLRTVIIQELENALAQQAPPPPQDDPSLHELPPLVIDGIPTPVEKMTQAQLRAFIPLMLKYSTGRGKPGWGKDSTRPPWWPKDVPWANVRMDARSEDDKQRVSWTHALRQIVINCYRYHGREDLLPAFSDEDESGRAAKQVKTEPEPPPPEAPTPQPQPTAAVQHYTPTMVQTISNPDGTVSIIHVDPNNPIITLPDGTTAQVQGVATFVPASQLGQGEGVLSAPDGTPMTAMEINSMTEGLSQEGHILLTSEDGQTYPVSVSGMITVPAMYQAVVANISQLQGADGTVQLCSSESFQQVMSSLMAHSVTKVEGATDDNGMGMGLSMTPMLAMGPGGTQHILQVTAAAVNPTSAQPEVDSSTITTINAMQVSSTDQEVTDSSPTSSTEQ